MRCDSAYSFFCFHGFGDSPTPTKSYWSDGAAADPILFPWQNKSFSFGKNLIKYYSCDIKN